VPDGSQPPLYSVAVTRAPAPLPGLAAACALLLLAGCSGGSSSTAAPVAAGTAPLASGTAPTSAVACPDAGDGGFPWPAGIPTDLPQPPGAVLTDTSPAAGGLTVVKFTTEQSLREGVLHLVRALQPAGYTLGRGDAEAAEADAPFTRGALRGIFRLVARDACTTDWLLAVAPEVPGAEPLLPPSSGSAPPSPLPFG